MSVFRLLLASFLISNVFSQTNLLVMRSSPGDYIGQGRTHVTTDGSSFSLTGTRGYVAVTTPFGYWIEFDAPGTTEELTVKNYTGAVRYPFNDSVPGIAVTGNGRGCNTIAGSFEIKEIGFDAEGKPNRLWATFSQSCEMFMPALTGEVRYNSQLAPEVSPRTIRVPSDYFAIQLAINAASEVGDTVLVAPGTYSEAIDFMGKLITVQSEQGPDATILSPPSNLAAVTFIGSENTNSILRGFTLRGGEMGVHANGASPLIESNKMVNCNYGIYGRSTSVNIRRNIIVGSGTHAIDLAGGFFPIVDQNILENGGGGIYLNGGEPKIRENIIRNNRNFGITIVGDSDPDIIQNLIYGNESAAVSWTTPAGRRGPFLEYNTIVGNLNGGTAAVSGNGWDARAFILNNIIVGTPALHLSPEGDTVPPMTTFNLFYSPTGPAVTGSNSQLTNSANNITSDPNFLDPAQGNFELLAGSPAIDHASETDSLPTDLKGTTRPVDGDAMPGARADIGAFEFVPGPPRPTTSLVGLSLETATELSWQPFDGAREFVISRGISVEGPFTNITTTTNLLALDTNIVQGTTYFYRIAGRNDLGTGQPSTPLRIKAGNRAPIAVRDFVEITEDSIVLFNPLENDSDPDNDPLTVELLTSPLPAGLSLTSTNVISYVPPQEYSGTNEIIYRVLDDRFRSATSSVVFVVVPTNDAPILQAITFNARANSNAVLVPRIIDPDSTNHQVLFSSAPLHGSVEALPGGRILYRPAHGYQGPDTFTYRVSDGQSESSDVQGTVFVSAYLDLDNDRIADIWETLWDLNNPNADPDNDGMNNLQEFLANTSPRNADSRVEIVRLEKTIDDHLAISWKAVGGTRYRVHSSDQLFSAESFVPLLQSAPFEIEMSEYGEESIRVFIDPRPLPQSGKRFYKIQVVQ